MKTSHFCFSLIFPHCVWIKSPSSLRRGSVNNPAKLTPFQNSFWTPGCRRAAQISSLEISAVTEVQPRNDRLHSVSKTEAKYLTARRQTILYFSPRRGDEKHQRCSSEEMMCLMSSTACWSLLLLWLLSSRQRCAVASQFLYSNVNI